MAWLVIFSTIVPNSYATTGIRTHSRVAPDWDLSDAVPTELHGRGQIIVQKSENDPYSCVIPISLLSLEFQLVGSEISGPLT